MTTQENSFTWLHLSDLHTGMTNHGWLWPTFKRAFFEDIKRLHSKTGNWDIVIFSGDLTQKGSSDEFEKLNNILLELWEEFRKLGFSPKLFTVPGNHDLSRPSEIEPGALLLNRWWDEKIVREDLWNNVNSPYKQTIENAFINYKQWAELLNSIGIPTNDISNGFLPGDSSTIITPRDIKIGLVGLNSAWLQLGVGDYRERLNIGIKQLHSITAGDPDKWCSENDINLLITHHPFNWLHPQSLNICNGEINVPGRFDAHLFGHMHEPDTISISQGGSHSKRMIQAASLFGLEKLSNGNQERIHGYSVGRITICNNEKSLIIWPRRDYLLTGGNRKLGPNQSFDLTEDNCLIENYSTISRSNIVPQLQITQPNPNPNPNQASSLLLSEDSISLGNTLKSVRYHLSPAKEHLNVRLIEQESCLAGIQETRAAWIISEWGMGTDGFIWALQNRLNENSIKTYRLDLQNYTSRQIFLDKIREQLDCSFEQFCELLSNEECNYLLFDDIPLDDLIAQRENDIEHDLEDMIEAILQYCPNIKIFLRSRRSPQNPSFPTIELKPLDEADTKNYIYTHSRGGEAMCDAEIISQLYRHTDGVPSRIDTALKDLEVISLSDLPSTNTDISGNDSRPTTIPHTLVRVVSSLSNSTDPVLKRAYELLKVLTIFPRGEQLSRIKRFYGPHPFYTSHVRELFDRALIDPQVVMEIGSTNSSGELAKTLVVSRPVREYVYTLLSENEFSTLNRKAVSLYFGEKWKIGNIKSPSGFRFDDHRRSTAEIENASMIVQRLMQEAISPLNNKKIKESIQVASYYCAALIKGCHFRSGAAFCNDFLPLIPQEEFTQDLAMLRYQHAKCLRMIGETARAKKIFMEIKNIDNSNFNKSIHQQLLLNMALCYKLSSETEDAIKAARESKKLNKHSNVSLHADSIILELSNDEPQRLAKLQKLQETARKRNATIVANNIALLLADQEQDLERRRELISKITITSGQSGDYYNRTRAAIKLGELSMKNDDYMTDGEISYLIAAYHYSYNQRLNGLFNKCHAALWDMFEKTGTEGVPNLLRLFRRSSFIWRLRNQDCEERNYLQKLTSLLGSKALSVNVRNANQEMAYFLARASVAINNNENSLDYKNT
ncbi:metallophosphoesterase [Methylobacter sp.]|uniref:metallophosphoesterase n=1 Tax=Methylobacter sp. TaxID=2051955 RepID=UPI003DA29FA9